MAAIGLGRLGEPAFANALIDSLSDRDALVRAMPLNPSHY